MTETEMYKIVINTIEILRESKYKLKHHQLHITRIESPMTPGIPDLNVCMDGHEFWIECKVEDNTPSPLQNSWRKRRQLAGGKSYVLNFSDPIFITTIEDRTYQFELPYYILEVILDDVRLRNPWALRRRKL